MASFVYKLLTPPGPHANSICWSEENLIAVANGNFVGILVRVFSFGLTNPADLQGPRGFVPLEFEGLGGEGLSGEGFAREVLARMAYKGD
eukprot:3356886-Pyramimonas_sp.AAC.1